VFITEVMDEFILGLDVRQAYDTSVDKYAICYNWVTRCYGDVVPNQNLPGSLVGEVIPARCERVVMARVEAPLGSSQRPQ
jgi:hypothetical protein